MQIFRKNIVFDVFKNLLSTSCANTRHGFIIFEADGMD